MEPPLVAAVYPQSRVPPEDGAGFHALLAVPSRQAGSSQALLLISLGQGPGGDFRLYLISAFLPQWHSMGRERNWGKG